MEKKLCDSCNKDFNEDDGGYCFGDNGFRFFCNPCMNIVWDEDDGQENDDPMSYREDY